MRIFLLIITYLTLGPSLSVAQEIDPADREKLRQAERAADIFVERFQRTLDFGTVWKEFRSDKVGCRLTKSDLVTSITEEEKVKIGTALLERAYVAEMNVYYLKVAHDLSILRLDSDDSNDLEEEQLTPKEILKAQKSSVYYGPNEKDPVTAKEIEDFVVELNRMAKLYRKYMPHNVMRSAAWRANYKYLTTRDRVHLEVSSGRSDFCIPENVNYYIVDRGMFYLYLVEENGKMKIIDLAVGN